MAVDYAYQGVLTPYPWLSVMPKTQYGIAQQWFVNRVPLQSFLPVLPTNNISFSLVTYKFRPRQITVVADPGAAGTMLTVLDGSFILNGDVIVLPSGEYVEATNAPTINQPTAPDTVPIRRGVGTGYGSQTIVAGTAIPTVSGTAISTANPALGWAVGNSRTGGEKYQLGINQVPTSRPQYVQTFQHVVQTSGVMQAIGGALPLPAGIPTPWEKNKHDAMQALVDDVENSCLYGVGEAVSGTNQRPKMYGAFNLITTNAVTSPTNASAYKPSDFENDVLGPIRTNGGQPSLMMISSGFRIGLARWGFPLQRFYDVQGKTTYGKDIQTYRSPFLGDIEIIENMWLNRLGKAAMVFTREEVALRELESLDYKPYGRTGDTGAQGEGDWIARMALEVQNEFHHGYVTGITGFSQES